MWRILNAIYLSECNNIETRRGDSDWDPTEVQIAAQKCNDVIKLFVLFRSVGRQSVSVSLSLQEWLHSEPFSVLPKQYCFIQCTFVISLLLLFIMQSLCALPCPSRFVLLCRPQNDRDGAWGFKLHSQLHAVLF